MTYVNITSEKIVASDPNKDVRVVKFVGQLDESNVDDNSKKIYDLIDEVGDNAMYLIFDLEKLEYMNSKAIGYLTDWYGKLTAKGGAIYIVKAKNNILDILQVVGLTQLIDSYPTLDEAKAIIDSN